MAASYAGKKLHVDVNKASITIGDRKDSSELIKGMIDAIGLFSGTLTEKDMKPLMDEGFPSYSR